MANEMISKDFSKHQIADVFQNIVAENDLGSGIMGGFAVVGYKGKTWSYRYRGEEQLQMRDDGDGPRSSLDVVILSSAKVLSKVWYEKGYVEGNTSPPDCWSGNSVHPDPASPKMQSPTCATCPRNVWGGRITENNKRAKECTDAKRMAVVPLDNIPNENLGGPMLLRVPAASLSDLASYGNEISKYGFPYYAVATKIAFDPEESYPKFKFTAIRPLSREEALQVIDLRNDPLIDRILAETGEAPLVEGMVGSPAATSAPSPAPSSPSTSTSTKAPPVKSKTINATAFNADGTSKSTVTPRKAAPKEEVEDAILVQEAHSDLEAADAETAGTIAQEKAGAGEEDEEAFDKALDAKLSAFLGGKNSS